MTPAHVLSTHFDRGIQCFVLLKPKSRYTAVKRLHPLRRFVECRKFLFPLPTMSSNETMIAISSESAETDVRSRITSNDEFPGYSTDVELTEQQKSFQKILNLHNGNVSKAAAAYVKAEKDVITRGPTTLKAARLSELTRTVSDLTRNAIKKQNITKDVKVGGAEQLEKWKKK